jgi:hypothetical protein
MMHRIALFSILLGLMGTALYACYPKPVGPTGADGKRLTWPEMALAQRQAHMKNVIIPRAGAVFRSWRPDRYQEINCTLCHGKNAEKGDFRMPTEHLPRLSGEVLLGPEFEKHPDTTRLKLKQLVPTMSEALGLRPFSLITRSGFGCYSCHLGPDGPMFGN